MRLKEEVTLSVPELHWSEDEVSVGGPPIREVFGGPATRAYNIGSLGVAILRRDQQIEAKEPSL